MGQPDRRNAGRSSLVPYKEGEHPSDRHSRRLDANLGHEAEVVAWCAPRDITLEVKNNGHHWIFKKGRWLAEWWPSSAKLVFNRKYQRGVHVHDWQQAVREIERVLRQQTEPGSGCCGRQ